MFCSKGTFRHRVGRALVAMTTLTLLTATAALAGEITDENEELEKIVWAVDAESTRDPELSVGGEKVQVEPGDLITFRIGINEDAVERTTMAWPSSRTSSRRLTSSG